DEPRRPRAGEHRRQQARRARARRAGVPAAMMVTRGAVLKSGGRGGGAGAARARPPRFLIRTAQGAERRGKVLVAIFQRGAVDGLGMVPPHGDPAYARARASIALAPPRRGDTATALDLDGLFALHPALAPLKPAWERETLAVVPH